jgi:tripartite-type tricarboxylate transporter receptor subunit TctC
MRKFKLFSGIVIGMLGLLLIAGNPGIAGAANYPNKPVTFICFSSPGGATDQTARSLAPIFQEILKAPFVVNNMPPLTVGTEYVYKAKKDGYTLLFSSEAVGTFRCLGLSQLSYHDFDPIMAFSEGIMTVTVGAKTPYKTVKEFFDFARKNPEKITVSHPGPSTSNYIAGKIIEKALNVKLRYLPYKGAGPAAIATIGGEVDSNFNNVSDVIEYHKSGNLRVLTTLTTNRAKYLPDVPALAEVYPELKNKLSIIPAPFYILSAPKGIDAEAKQALVEASKKAVQDPRWLKQVDVMASQALHYTGKELETYLNNWESEANWTLKDEGIAVRSPEEFGIPRIK